MSARAESVTASRPLGSGCVSPTMFDLVTPFGTVSSRLADVRSPEAATSWTTDELEISCTATSPRYDDVTFAVDGHHAWLWRVRVLRDVPRLRFTTRLAPPPTLTELTAEPVQAPWVLGVVWRAGGAVQAIGTSDLDALMVRTGDGEWLPHRYLEELDPTRPGQVPFLERTAVGLSVTFDQPRAGEAFEHHAVIAWSSGGHEAAVMDAMDVEATGILGGHTG